MLVIFLCGFSGFLFIRSDAFLNYLRVPLENALQKQVAKEYSITLDKLSGDILTGVRVEKFAISERVTKKPVILTSAIELKYNLFGLLRRKFLVTALKVSFPQVYVRSNAAGEVNLTQVLRESSQESSDFSFAVSAIAITDGVVYFTDAQQDFKIEIPGIKVELKGSLGAWQHTGKFSFDKGSFAFKGTEMPVEPFAGSFSLSAQGGELEELQLKSGNSVLTLSGGWDGRTWHTLMQLTVDAADVQKITNSKHTLRGKADIRLKANGTDENLMGHITAQVPTVSINDILMEQLEVSAEFTDQELTLKNATGKIAGGEVSGKGQIAKTTGNVARRFNYDGTMAVKDVQLLALLPMFIELPEGNPHLNSGTLAGTAQVRGDTSGRLQLESSLQLSETTFLVKRNRPVDTTEIALKDSFLNCTISAVAEHNAQVTADGTLDEAYLNIEGSINNLQLTLRDVDFGKLSQIFNSAPFAGIGSLTAQITKEGTARGYVEVPATTFMDIPIGVLTGDFRYADGRMFIENGHLTKGKSDIEIAGTVDIEGELPANFEIVLAPLQIDADYTRLLMGAIYPVEGTLTGELKLDGSLTHLDGRGTFTVNAGKAWGIRLDPLTLPLEIDDYTVTISNFDITTRNQLVTLNVRKAANGDFDLSIKNSTSKPIQLAEIATAADISDFPFDAQLEVSVIGDQKQSKDLDLHIELDFSEITFLGNPLGDVYLFGKLVERKKTTGEPDIFDFHGSGFEETGRIRGYISMATDNPYRFEMQSKATPVTPVLRILHPALEAITGTADGIFEITGTIAELAPPAATDGADSAIDTERLKQRVYPYDVDITIPATQLHYNGIPLTNSEPIRLQLVDDLWTFAAFSLAAEHEGIQSSALTIPKEKSPFIQLIGTFDAESEAIDISATSNSFALEPFGPAVGFPISGAARYALTATGTLAAPIVAAEWAVPTLAIGELSLSDASGAITYQDNTLNIEPFSLQLLGNRVQVEGDIVVLPEDFNNTENGRIQGASLTNWGLNLRLGAADLALTKFSDLVKNRIPLNILERLTTDKTPLMGGHLGVSIDVTGSLAKPIIGVNAHTLQHQPIRLGVFAKPITLEKLRAVTEVTPESIHISDLNANGRIGEGEYQIQGETLISTKIPERGRKQSTPIARNVPEEAQFDIALFIEQLEVSDFATLFLSANGNGALPVHGTVSGNAKLIGAGFHPHLITVTCNVDKLNLQIYNRERTETGIRPDKSVPVFHVSDMSPFPLRLQYMGEKLDGHLPLRITSPAMETNVNVNIAGALTAPEITAKWEGTSALGSGTMNRATTNQLRWTGDVQYRDERINIVKIELRDNSNRLTLNGRIPFDLQFADVDISERFLDEPLDVQLRGQELPLNFFPWLDTVFLEAEGVVDINLALQGTTRSPHLHGALSLQAGRLHLNTFNQILTNATLQLKAQQINHGTSIEKIDVTKLQFEMEGGRCDVAQGQLILDGLTPERFELAGLKFEQYPLGSTVRNAELPDALDDIKGHVTATLNELIIPLNSFFQHEEKIPIPQIREMPSFDALLQEARAEFSIDNLFFGFIALERHYDFRNPHPISILLDSGQLRLEGFRLEAAPPKFSTAPTKFGSDVSIEGYGRWNIHGELLARLQLDNFDVSALNALLPPEYQMKGTLSADIIITGTDAAPEVTVQWEGQGLGINQADIDTFTAELRYADRRWVISEDNPARLTLGVNQLTGSGTVPYLLSFWKFYANPLPEPIEGNIRLEMKALEVLPLINPFLQSASGTGIITATVGGTPAAPRFVGSGEFNKVAFELPNAGVSLKDTEVRLDFSETGINIGRLEGKLNNGNFSVTGGITSDWLNVNDMALNAYLNANRFVQPGQYRLNIDSADLHLSGHPTKPRLTGNVNIRDGHYEQNWENVRDWFAGTTVTETEVALDTPLLRDIQLDVEINMPNNFHLLSSLGGPTDIEIACFGRLIGPIQQPIFSGDVSILRGKISIITQVFEFVEGSAISNRSAVDFDPELNILLQTPNPIRGVLLRDGNTADVMVRAVITGTLNNANLSFVPETLNTTSTEVLTDADIIVLLYPGNSISRAFGGITFTLSSGLEPDTRHISAQYPLPFSENMSIKMERDEEGEYGVDFQWEQRF